MDLRIAKDISTATNTVPSTQKYMMSPTYMFEE